MKQGAPAALAATLSILATILAGCGTPRSVSATGEATVLTAPPAEIRGATVHDQKWIDGTIEAGVQGLGWQRPGPRPPEWDRPAAAPRQTEKRPPARTASEAIERAVEKKPVPRPRPRWLQMLRRKEAT